MHPKLLEIPFIHLPIYAYGFMVMMGFLTAIFITSRRADRDDIKPEIIFDIGLIAMIAGIVGARIFYLIYFSESFDFGIFDITDGGLSIIGVIIGFFLPITIRYLKPKNQKETTPLQFSVFIKLLIVSIISAIIAGRIIHLFLNRSLYNWNLFYVWQGGLVFYGGVVLAIISIIIYLKTNKLSILKTGDLVMPAILLGLAFGRIGCFLNGCCYGKVSSVSWAACFPAIHNEHGKIIGSPAFIDHLHQGRVTEDSLLSLPVHPTELYESLMAILFFIILTFIWLRKKRFSDDGKPAEGRHGFVIAWAGILYGIGRFMIELLRGDNKSFISGLSYSQLVSIGLFIIGMGLLIWLSARKDKTATQAT